MRYIHLLFARFLWGCDDVASKIHWTKWFNVCFPYEEGGLGVSNLFDITTSFSFKLWWKVQTEHSFWALKICVIGCASSCPLLSLPISSLAVFG